MHELSIVESFLQVAIEHAEKEKAERIIKINIVVGEMTGVVREAVDFYFNFLSRDTIASQATIDFKHIRTRLRCRDCGELFHPENMNYRCPKCDCRQVDIVGGRELYVESIEIV
ncbi:MAG: hydrogenase maturation nickel metallochaperone HypA [Dehalococcoidales bacterium]|nr:hydrogenase maturation nickel metallochaperone HypA [Dehalococcoidales bacterium]